MKFFSVIALLAVIASVTLADSQNGQHKLTRTVETTKQSNNGNLPFDPAAIFGSPRQNGGAVTNNQPNIVEQVMQFFSRIRDWIIQFIENIANGIPVLGPILQSIRNQFLPGSSGQGSGLMTTTVSSNGDDNDDGFLSFLNGGDSDEGEDSTPATTEEASETQAPVSAAGDTVTQAPAGDAVTQAQAETAPATAAAEIQPPAPEESKTAPAARARLYHSLLQKSHSNSENGQFKSSKAHSKVNKSHGSVSKKTHTSKTKASHVGKGSKNRSSKQHGNNKNHKEGHLKKA